MSDLPDYVRIESRDADRAADLASRFHQLFSECVYAFGGTVSDTMGSIVIAELPDATQAIHSIENLERRVENEFASEPALSPRAVMTRGEVHEKDFSIAGQAVQNALSILDSLRKNQMLVAEDLVTETGRAVPGDPILTLGQTGYFALPLTAPAPPKREPTAPGVSEVPGAGRAEGEPGESGEAAPEAKSRKPVLIAAAVVLVLFIGAIGFWMAARPEPEPVVTEEPAPAPAPAPEETTVELSFGGIQITPEIEADEEEKVDASILVESLLRSVEGVEMNALASNVVGADVRMIAAEPEGEPAAPDTAAAQTDVVPVQADADAEPHVVPWVERSGERFEGESAPFDGVWSIVAPTVRWAGDQLAFPTERLIPESQELREAYRNLVVSTPAETGEEMIAELHQALLSEPEFLAGWLALSSAETDDPELQPAIMDALRNISRLMPARTDLARDLGQRELEEGTLAGAVEAFGRVHAEEPGDEEALETFAFAALAAHQPELFTTFTRRIDDPRFHPADVEVTEGKINEGVKKYYETEAESPDNRYLSFKIGRIAVLRRSPQIAQIEMDKLESSGLEPQRSFLRAYMAADDGNRSDAEAALREALENASWSDSPWFHAAEVYAILRDAEKTVEAIEKSVERQEPMMHAIATNPLFRYLTGEARFREAVRQLLQHQRAIGERLGQVA